MVAVVLDTNVIISGHLKKDGPEAAVLQLVYARRVHFLTSEPILAEYAEVMRRPKFGFSPVRVNAFLGQVRVVSQRVVPTVTVSACTDPDDNKFLECALAGGADAMVTGNKRHFPPREFRGISIISAPEFIGRFVVSEI